MYSLEQTAVAVGSPCAVKIPVYVVVAVVDVVVVADDVVVTVVARQVRSSKESMGIRLVKLSLVA